MSWLQGASDFVDQIYNAGREHQGGIYSTKAVKASTTKVADLLATAVAIQEEDACWRRLNSDPPCRSNIDPGRIAEFGISNCG